MFKCVRSLALAALLCASLSKTAIGQLLAPDASVAGVSQAEYSVRWTQWAFSFPDGAHPIQDLTGSLSHLGDQGNVFFLAGSFSTAPVVRNATVRPDQHLFFPLVNVASIIPFFGNTEADIRQDAADDLGVVSDLALTLNGNPLSPPTPLSLLDYHQVSPPGLFDLAFPANDPFGIGPAVFPAVSDGYWAMLSPLASGNYLLHFEARSEGTGPYVGDLFTQDITYRITVVPEPGSAALLASLFIPGAMFARRRSRR